MRRVGSAGRIESRGRTRCGQRVGVGRVQCEFISKISDGCMDPTPQRMCDNALVRLGSSYLRQDNVHQYIKCRADFHTPKGSADIPNEKLGRKTNHGHSDICNLRWHCAQSSADPEAKQD